MEEMTVSQIGDAMLKPCIITEDITDVRDEWLRREIDLSDEGKVNEAIGNGITVPEVSRYLVAGRQSGSILPEKIPFLRPNRLLIFQGAACDVQSFVTRQMREAILANGKTIKIRRWIGEVHEKEAPSADGNNDEMEFEASGPDNGKDNRGREAGAFVDSEHDKQEAVRLALRYLENDVPGYVYGRLAIVASCGGDVRQAASILKSQIDEMVGKLTTAGRSPSVKLTSRPTKKRLARRRR